MQFSRAIILAVAAIASANAAAIGSQQIQPELSIRASSSDIKSQVNSVASSASKSILADNEKLSKLDSKTVQISDVKPIFQDLNSKMQQAGSQLKKLHQEYKNASSSKRQDLDGAVNQLVKDLNKTLKTAQPLVRHLTENLELGTVQDLVDLLTPGLATLVSGVEGLLIDLAPGLATIVDPLLVVVEGLTKALGLNLNLPALPSTDKRAEASSKSQAASAANEADSEIESSMAKLEKLDVNTVTVDDLKPIFKDLSASMQSAATKFQQINKDASNMKRQALLVPAVTELIKDLNKTLKTAQPLVRHLTENLELGTVQDLVDLLTPGLAALVSGVEGLLAALAPGLSTLVDPLLRVVYGLTAGLGLNLNLPALPSN